MEEHPLLLNLSLMDLCLLYSLKNLQRSEKKTMNFQDLKPVFELSGSWDVQFDRDWFYPVEGSQAMRQRKIHFHRP